MNAHYAGSIAYDNEHDEWEDHVLKANDIEELLRDMKAFMKRRKNAEVFFAAFINKRGKESDITDKVKELMDV